MKFDTEKDMWELVPFEVLDDLVKVLTYGAKKYEPNNWQKLANGEERYFAALMRHLSAWRRNELVDPESGLPHLSHALCNLVFLCWLGQQKPRITKTNLQMDYPGVVKWLDHNIIILKEPVKENNGN